MSFQMRLGLQVNDTLAPLPYMPDHWNYLLTQFLQWVGLVVHDCDVTTALRLEYRLSTTSLK